MNHSRESWVDVLRFPLIVGVILIHGYEPAKAMDGKTYSLQGHSEVANEIMFFISQVLAHLSVPLFFLFADYFFIEK